ncbi:MAG: hypothetical protein IKJ26_01925 [Clostridia bacterium]|nr:hypothetical protein [Clostridia bacterium]
MSCYVIAVGGTGNKILESIVYAACADAFYTYDANGQRVPIRKLDMLSVDVDAACGNTTRAKRAAEYYEEVRQAFSASPYEHRCFHTALSVDRWSTDLSRRASSVEKMAQNHQADKLLARTLFSQTEMQLEYSEGFRGHPDLGVLFFADLLGSLDEARSAGLPDEFNALIDRMQADINSGETVKIILCGSIFGGTGASGIPAISKYLRRRFAAHSDQFVMGSMLMLPYYKVPPANVDETREIAVDSDFFLDKARTALQYYGMESMIRDSDDDPNGLFDAVYLLGLPPEHFVSTRIYSTGSQSQENDAHMLEWLAARCVAQFMRTGFRGIHAHNIDCYYYQWHTPQFSWASFDEDSALYQARYGTLCKAAAVFFAECFPALQKLVSTHDRRSARIPYCSAYFHRLRRMSAAQRAQLESRLDALYHFFAFYINWMTQLIGAVPPGLRGSDRDGLPENGLFLAQQLDTLMRILSSRTDEDAAQLEKSIERLIVNTVPDKRNMRRILQALGGGETAPGPDGSLAAFLTALLDVVYEDD